jgi:hypothetical protein
MAYLVSDRPTNYEILRFWARIERPGLARAYGQKRAARRADGHEFQDPKIK